MEEMSDNEKNNYSDVEEETSGNDSDDRNKYNDFSDGGLITSFCQLDVNEFFIEINEEFLRNRANLYGIPKEFKHFE